MCDDRGTGIVSDKDLGHVDFAQASDLKCERPNALNPVASKHVVILRPATF